MTSPARHYDPILDHPSLRQPGQTLAPLTATINKPGVTAEIVDLTPELAAKLLSKNNHNRPLRDRYAKRLAHAMLRGEWKFNGDTIVVSDTGELLQGQHRCKAVTLANVTIRTILVSGIPDDAFDTLDRGLHRQARDVFAIQGVHNATAAASIVRLICVYESTGNPFNATPEAAPTIQQIEKRLHEDEEAILKATRKSCANKWVVKYVSQSIGGFCYYVFSKQYQDQADEFFRRLSSGTQLEKGSPILLLRDRLMEDKDKKERIKISYRTALIFKAFKLYLDGATVKALRVRQEGEAVEKDIYAI